MGLDIARAIAIVGMVIVNFKVAMGAEGGGPAWLRTAAAMLDGRAAALFVVLAGIGASLASRRSRLGGDPALRRRARVSLARRAGFLFVMGWIFFTIWPADILHYYGLYLGVGAVVLFASARYLLLLALAAIAVSASFVLTFDYFANWNLTDLSYSDLMTPAGFFRNMFFDGFHPVFPWVAFYLFGLWLGRTDLRDPAWRRALVFRAAVPVAVVEAAAWAFLGPKGASREAVPDDSWRWLFSVDPIPPLPLYVVAGAGTAILVILASIWLGERLPPRVTEPLVSTGQLALTIYVAHVVVGMGVLEAAGRLEEQTLSWAVETSLAFSFVSVVGAWAWRRRYDRGPFEWLLRRVAG